MAPQPPRLPRAHKTGNRAIGSLDREGNMNCQAADFRAMGHQRVTGNKMGQHQFDDSP